MHADQLAGCLDDSSKWHRYEKISRHLRQAIASAGAIPSSGDVLGYLASTKWLVQQHLRCGQLAEAYQLQVMAQLPSFVG